MNNLAMAALLSHGNEPESNENVLFSYVLNNGIVQPITDFINTLLVEFAIYLIDAGKGQDAQAEIL